MRTSSPGSTAMRVVHETDGTVTLCLQGDFGLANVRGLGEQIDQLLGYGRNLTVDLSQTTFVDASIIRVLVRALDNARAREQAIVVQLGPPSGIVERVLQITGTDQILPCAHGVSRCLCGSPAANGAGIAPPVTLLRTEPFASSDIPEICA